MFDAVLNSKDLSGRRFGTGAIFAITLHGGVVALILWVSTGEPTIKRHTDLAVKFMKAVDLPPSPPPPPPRLASGTSRPHAIEQRPVRRPDKLAQPKEIPKDKPREADPEQEAVGASNDDQPSAGGTPGGVAGGVAGGTEGGLVGGVVGGVPGGQLGGNVLPFGEGMTRPEQLSGEPIRYTREALAAQVEGTILLKCVITIIGKLENCRVIKPLPHMSQAVLDAVSTWRYKPVHYQGRPVAVDYLIQIKLVIPH
ncbi:MAG TPA: TonB family protein [Myxococcales bacterium]